MQPISADRICPHRPLPERKVGAPVKLSSFGNTHFILRKSGFCDVQITSRFIAVKVLRLRPSNYSKYTQLRSPMAHKNIIRCFSSFLPVYLPAPVYVSRRLFCSSTRRLKPLADGKSSTSTVDLQLDGLKALRNVPLIWLRDCCQCSLCFDKKTHQRKESSGVSTTSPAIKSMTLSSLHRSSFDIEWNDGHHSSYEKYFIEKQFFSHARRLRPKLWTTNEQLQVTFTVGDLDSSAGIAKILTHLLTNGLAFINGVQPSEQDTLRAVSAIAKPFDSIYGVVSTCTSDASRSDTAYSTLPIAPHTDTTYYQTPLRLMALQCIERSADTIGGESMFVDGFQIARQLREKSEELYKALFEIPQEFCYIERSKTNYYTLSSISTVLRSKRGSSAICEPDELLRVRFNMYDRGFAHFGTNPTDLQKQHESLREFQRLTLREENQWRTVLKPGTLALYDNWRVLHARTGFEGRRALTSVYIGEEEFSSALTKHGVVEDDHVR